MLYVQWLLAHSIGVSKNLDDANSSPFGILSDTELKAALMLIEGVKGLHIAEKMNTITLDSIGLTCYLCV